MLRVLEETRLVFVSFDLKMLRIVPLMNAGFPSDKEAKILLGFIITMADGYIKSNIVHFGFIRCLPVTR